MEITFPTFIFIHTWQFLYIYFFIHTFLYSPAAPLSAKKRSVTSNCAVSHEFTTFRAKRNLLYVDRCLKPISHDYLMAE